MPVTLSRNISAKRLVSVCWVHEVVYIFAGCLLESVMMSTQEYN